MPSDIVVTLDWIEFAHAVDDILYKQATSVHRGLNHANAIDRDFMRRLSDEVVGSCAEYAVAKWMGLWWSPGLNVFHNEADCHGYHVRASLQLTNRLLLRSNDDPNGVYILVTGAAPELHIRGWLFGREVFQDKYMSNPGGFRTCWMAPQEDLHPMEHLPKL